MSDQPSMGKLLREFVDAVLASVLGEPPSTP